MAAERAQVRKLKVGAEDLEDVYSRGSAGIRAERAILTDIRAKDHLGARPIARHDRSGWERAPVGWNTTLYLIPRWITTSSPGRTINLAECENELDVRRTVP